MAMGWRRAGGSDPGTPFRRCSEGIHRQIDFFFRAIRRPTTRALQPEGHEFMRMLGCVEPRAKVDILTTIISVAAILCLADVTPAFAIPSPELIVGSFTSISQLIALASALIGGGATLVTLRARARNGGPSALSRWVIAIMAAAVVLLMMSVGFNIYQYVGTKNERHARLEQTLLRPATTPGGPKLDPANLEL